MISAVPPAFIFIIGGLLLPLLGARRLKQVWLLFVPALAFADLLVLPNSGTSWTYHFLGYNLVFGKIDTLSLCFGYVFCIMAFLGMVYALHVKEEGQHLAAMFYIGSALGVTFAGDLFTLFIFWEIMAASSVFLIWYQRDKAALGAGFRYLLVHLFGGSALLAGIIIHVSTTGSTQFGSIDYGSLSSLLILLGFIINAAVPPFHAWLSDAYPEATVTGSVFLTAFTTKSAVYVLIRAFAGVELLVWMGAIMAVYGVVYAVLENDIRRLLAYHIISQVGYMVCGVGLGTEMALNGSTVHAFCHILYKALLFMGAASIIHVTGKRKLTDLQGRNLYKKMPICLSLYMVGAFSISAVPLFNGFISKTMVVAAAGDLHRPVIYLLLHLASIGTFLHTGLKLPYGIWFGKASKGVRRDAIEAKEPPLHMLIAMGMTALLCIVTGVFPSILYNLLPYPVHYQPYTPYHIVGMMQLLLLTGGAFLLLVKKLGGEPTISLDTDWFYRKGAGVLVRSCYRLDEARAGIQAFASRMVEGVIDFSKNPIQLVQTLFSRKKPMLLPYNADTYRPAIGVGVMLLLVVFFVFCVILFSRLGKLLM